MTRLLLAIATRAADHLRRGGCFLFTDLSGRSALCHSQLLQSRVQVLRKEAVHQKALREIPWAYGIERIFVVDVFGERRVADHLADANRDGLVQVESVDRIPVFLRREQQTEQAHEQRVRGFEVEPLCGTPWHGL